MLVLYKNLFDFKISNQFQCHTLHFCVNTSGSSPHDLQRCRTILRPVSNLILRQSANATKILVDFVRRNEAPSFWISDRLVSGNPTNTGLNVSQLDCSSMKFFPCHPEYHLVSWMQRPVKENDHLRWIQVPVTWTRKHGKLNLNRGNLNANVGEMNKKIYKNSHSKKLLAEEAPYLLVPPSMQCKMFC